MRGTKNVSVKLTLAGVAALASVWVAVHLASRQGTPPAPPGQARQTSMTFQRRPRLPAPRLPLTLPSADAAVESRLTTNLFARILNGDPPRLTPEQVEPFLLKNGRSVESLLGAFEATGDRAFLREALEKNPNDPRANFAAFFRAEPYDNTQPASPERRQLLEALVRSAPDNALANYLLAFDDFKSGHTDQAVQQLLAAAQKANFQDFTREFILDAEDAYRAAGWSETDAKAVATYGAALPHLAELKQTGLKLIELADQYRQAGDAASAQAALDLGLGLGQRLTAPGQISLIHELVGTAIELKTLEAMDPASVIGTSGQTVQGQLDAIAQRRASIKETFPKVEAIVPTLAEADLVSFCDRMSLLGEDAAVQWLLKTRVPQSSP